MISQTMILLIVIDGMGWVGNVWGRDKKGKSALFEIARLLVRLDHVARIVVNANHGIM